MIYIPENYEQRGKVIEQLITENTELKDKLSRRNMQIRELKKRIEQLEINTVYQGKL